MATSPGISGRHQEPSSMVVFLKSLHASLLGGLEPQFCGQKSIPETYPKLKSSVLADGYRAAFVRILIAIFINHIWTILFARLNVSGAMWYTPMENLRLARSNPDVFFVEFHSYSGMSLFLFALYHLALRYVGQTAAASMIAEKHSFSAGQPRREDALAEIRNVGYIVWVFATTELLFSRGVNMYAWFIAMSSLVSGEDAGYAVLKSVVGTHMYQVLGVGVVAFHGTVKILLPLCLEALRLVVFNGQPGLALFIGFLVGAVSAVIAYRSIFFIALEVSGMFVATGWLVVALLVFATWFVDDRKGLKMNTVFARERGSRAKRLLSKEQTERVEILRSKTSRSQNESQVGEQHQATKISS
ncbi:hypothetical protein B0H66DRAFT_569326 [Apodospora peruviana]|uniref:Transmembrane protein n=1 Tax=Apodospora peruviana TaxID=516989 RepID=A0AAE0LZ44_9PEZI|nr:hypothetical protein B0H66DRAFT_569326 [Apodospora peruviana]